MLGDHHRHATMVLEALDQLGAKPAIESLVARVAHQTDLDITLDYEGDAARHEPEVESTLYRLVQEALTNVAKHARASRVEVRVRDAGGQIALTVRDDGAGFDARQTTSGFGLIGMRERLALVGGTLEIRSDPGGGTVLRASIPVRELLAAAGEEPGQVAPGDLPVGPPELRP